MQVKVADDVTMSDPAAAEVARWMVSAGRHSHQSMLPWLWEVLSDDDMAHAPGGLPCCLYVVCCCRAQAHKLAAPWEREHLQKRVHYYSCGSMRPHQSMLPWLWEVLSDDDMAHAPGELIINVKLLVRRLMLPCTGFNFALQGAYALRQGAQNAW
jgi:hypothetical protein